MISAIVFVKNLIQDCLNYEKNKKLAIRKDEPKYDMSFFDVDPFKNHLQVETTDNELSRLLYTLRKPGVSSIRSLAHQIEPLGHCCPQMDAIMDFLNDLVEIPDDDSGIESSSDYSLSPKVVSRAPSPDTTWY